MSGVSQLESMSTRSKVNQSRGCPGNHFDSLKDDPIEICKLLATDVRKKTGCEVCLIEIFEAESKSSVLFHLDTSLSSPGLPFSRFQFREWNPVSCEGEWSRGTVLGPYMGNQISRAPSTSVPKEWIQLHQRLGMESVLTYPLSVDAQFQTLLGSITLGHRNPGFFTSNETMYRNLLTSFRKFAMLAPVMLMKEMSRLVWQLNHNSSVTEQVQFLQSFLTKTTPAIGATLALFDQSCDSAELFINPNDAEDQNQCKPMETMSIKLQKNTAIWNLHFGGESVGIECNMESTPSSSHLDLDFIYQKKSANTKSMWILPIRKAAFDRNQAMKSQVNQKTRVLGLSIKPGNPTINRWNGFLGAVYLHKSNNTVFSDFARKKTVLLIRYLYHMLERTLRRSEIQRAIDKPVGSSPAPTDPPEVETRFNRPANFEEQMMRVRETQRRNVQNYKEDLSKLKIDWLIDSNAANSVVFHGMYNNRPSAVKIMIDVSLRREQAFRTRMEHSILTSVDHPNIVRLLGSAIKVSGAKVLNTACFGNSKEVEDCLKDKWGQPGSMRSIDLSLFILEYCDKGSLELMIHKERKFQQEGFYKRDLVLTLLDISKPMEYLHQRGIVHGDLKPANVLVKKCKDGIRDWCCCIADFGSSLRRENMSQMSFFGQGCTLAYRAPEIMSLRDLSIHNRFEDRSFADVYSFGMIIYEIMEGRTPFAGQDAESISKMVCELNKHPELTSQEHPETLVDLMKRCWTQDPKQRPSFAKITTELKTLLSLEDLAQES